MSRILVAYYSRSGNTGMVANALTESLRADEETIQESNEREGWTGFLRSAMDVIRKRTVPILPGHFRPDDYDLVVVGTPVWVGHVAAPVRTFLTESGPACKSLAFFCTMGGSNPSHAFADMEKIAGSKPLATLGVSEKELAGDAYLPRVRNFALTLEQRLVPEAPSGTEATQGAHHVGT